MIQFPGTVEIPFRNTVLKFSIVPIDKNIYAMSNDMSLIKNDDKMTFGYLIYKDGYLYAYGISPIGNPNDNTPEDEQKFRFDIVFSTYVAPENVTISDQTYIHALLTSIGIAFGNRALYQVQHPSIVQRNRFTQVLQGLITDIEKLDDPGEFQSPYIHTMLQTARSLADFYTTMAKNLENLTLETSI